MKPKCEEILKGIIHYQFENQIDLTSTFLRFQEYFESPEFKGKFFDLKSFKKWYKTTTKSKKFSYYTDWSGFNFPSKILKPFYEGEFDPLSKKEKYILENTRKYKGKFYVIGTFSTSSHLENAFNHEIAHALFYINKKYKKEVLNIMHGLNLKKLKNKLEERGYDKSVHIDECHAHIMSDLNLLKDWGIGTNNFINSSKKLRSIFYKYTKEIS